MIALFRVKVDKLVEFVEEWNELPMREQLGRPIEECLTFIHCGMSDARHSCG